MDHRIEYFHTLVEQYFIQEEYEVSYVDKVFYVTIFLTKSYQSLHKHLDSDNHISSSKLRFMSRMMVNCLCVFLKPYQFKVSVRLPQIEITDDIKKDYDYCDKL